MSDLRRWLVIHPEIQLLYPGEDVLLEQFESEVKNFVQLRNDAAHGVLEEIEGRSNLFRLCDVVNALILSIGSFMRKSIAVHLETSHKIKMLGVVTESFSNGAFIVRLAPSITIDKSTNLLVLSRNNCLMQSIQSLQINGRSVSKVKTKRDGLELGVRCSTPIKVGSTLLASFQF